MYYRHNNNALFIKDFITIPIQCALSAAKIMILEQILKKHWSKLCEFTHVYRYVFEGQNYNKEQTIIRNVHSST